MNMGMDEHNFHWALGKLNEGKAVSRDHRLWAGKKLFKLNQQKFMVEKKSSYHPHAKGQIIVGQYLVTIKEGILWPFEYGTIDIMATDWSVVKEG